MAQTDVNKPTPKEETFCQEFLKTGNQSEAYRRAFDTSKMKASTVSTRAVDIMRVPRIKARISTLQARVLERTEVDAAAIVRQLVDIATADPNELTQYRRVNCRFCSGKNHQYHWKNRGEFQKAMDDWCEKKEAHDDRQQRAKKLKPFNLEAPSDEGGYGFRNNADANPDCPECEGEGVEEMFVADTRKLTGAAKRLYAGAKFTKNGVEIMMRSQDAALKLLGDHFGIFKTIIDANVKSENLNINANGEPLSREQLVELLKTKGLPTAIFDKRK
jgi:phage terminase small subunit